jgi:hypothetical protein
MINPSWGANPRLAGESAQMLVKAPPPRHVDPTLHVLFISPSYAVVCYEIAVTVAKAEYISETRYGTQTNGQFVSLAISVM